MRSGRTLFSKKATPSPVFDGRAGLSSPRAEVVSKMANPAKNSRRMTASQVPFKDTYFLPGYPRGDAVATAKTIQLWRRELVIGGPRTTKPDRPGSMPRGVDT